MATIIIHAGMPKTGSTSLQRWIIDHCDRLREDHGVHTLVATSRTRRNPTDEIRLEPYESGRVNSGPLVNAWYAAGQSSTIARRFLDDLATFAELYPTVLVTAEGLSQVFWRVDETFLLGLEELAQRHELRVAYYVRPQHTAIEANWREAGYKQGLSPSRYVLEQTERGLHYLRTLEVVDRLAPSIGFVMRPFRTDLLHGANPVADFLHRFLSLDEDTPDVHENPGLPLQVVNVLRFAPEGWFYSENGEVETYPRRKLRKVFEGLEVGDDVSIRRSRLILQQYCNQVFERQNQELIGRLRWSTAEFVPPARGLEGECDIADLDRLWAPDASEAECALLYHALRAALA